MMDPEGGEGKTSSPKKSKKLRKIAFSHNFWAREQKKKKIQQFWIFNELEMKIFILPYSEKLS